MYFCVCMSMFWYFVHSGIEQRHEIYSCAQLTAENTSKPESEQPSIVELPPVITTSIDQTPRTCLPYPLPQPATAKIFAPRTEDMNKGFLMFSDDEPGLTSKF